MGYKFINKNGKEKAVHPNQIDELLKKGWKLGRIKGRYHSKETKQKISISKMGDKNPTKRLDVRKKISNTLKGRISPMKGETHSKEAKQKMRDFRKGKSYEEIYGVEGAQKKKEQLSNKAKSNLNYGMKGKTHSEKSKRKMRIAKLDNLEKNYGVVYPGYNLEACKFFDQLNELTFLQGQHALNESEFHIKDLGYWLDFYDPTNKVIIEWDEKHHFDLKGNLREKDVQRQNEIMDKFPDYLFIRLEDKEYDEQEIKELGNDLLKICA